MLDANINFESYKNARERRIAAENRVFEHEREAYPYDAPERLEEYNRAHADLEREAEKARQAEEYARNEVERMRDLERQAYEARMEGIRDTYHIPDGRDNDATEKLRHQMDDKELNWKAQDQEIQKMEEALQKEREEKNRQLEEHRKKIWAENERKREEERVKYRAELERRKQEEQRRNLEGRSREESYSREREESRSREDDIREREESRSRHDDERELDRDRGYGEGRSR